MSNNRKPRLYVMCGLSGSGKTTFAKEFAKSNGLLYLCPDVFYAAFNGDDRIHENTHEVWMAVYSALRTAELNRKDTVLDTNCLTKVHRTQFLDWYPGFEHHLITVSTNPDMCLKNNASRRRVIPEEIMLDFIKKFEFPSPETETDQRWVSKHYIVNDGCVEDLLQKANDIHIE